MVKKSRKAKTERMDIDKLTSYLQKELKTVKVEKAIARFEDEGDVEPLATGNPWLDLITGIGGLPKGKIVEFSGEEGVSKSALNQSIAGVIQHGGVIRPFRENHADDEELEASNVVWIDAERAIDLRIPKQRHHFADRLGMDIDNLIIVKPDTAELAFEVARACIVSGSVDFIVLDSIVALATADDYDKDMTEGSWNKLPQVINRGLKNIAPELERTDCVFVVLNQLRANTQKKNKFDKDWVTTGGKGLKHWCTLRVELTSSGKIKDENNMQVGHRVRTRIIKTRLDINHGDAFLYWYNDTGFNYAEELFNLAVEWEVIYKPSNGWYEFGVEDELFEEYGKLREKDFIELLNTDEELYNKTYEYVKQYFAEDSEASEDIDGDMEDQEYEDDDEDEYEDEEE